MRQLMSFLVKAGISALLLYLSLRRVNLDGIGQRLGGLDLRWIIFMFFILSAQMALVALRWREIVETCGANLSLATALSYSFIGQFFSQVLPSTVGGDAARIWLLVRRGAGWPTASYSVLIDRVVGVSALAVLVVLCLPWTLNVIHDPIARAAVTLIGFGTLAGALAFLAFGIVESARDGTLVDYPPSRSCFMPDLATVQIWHRRARRGVFAYDSTDDRNSRLGGGPGRSRRNRSRRRFDSGPAGDADRDFTGFDRRMGRT